MRINHLLEKSCILTFIVMALTSIPLFVSYLKNTPPRFQWIVDLHAWFGMAFIILVSMRILSNRQFVKAMIVGGRKK